MRSLSLLSIVALLLAPGSRTALADDSDTRLESVREDVAYCRWNDAREEGSALRKTVLDAGGTTDALDDVIQRAETDARDERLKFLFLTALSRQEDDHFAVWLAKFASRPKIAGSVRVNFYLATEGGALYGLSRLLQDVSRGEHGIRFGFDKMWQERDGKPVALRVELCYAGHCVDVMTEGKEPPSEWWKSDALRSGLMYGVDGYKNEETKSYRFRATALERWTLTSVTFTGHNGISPIPLSESADPLPSDEASLPKLPAPHLGYRAKSRPAAGAPKAGAAPVIPPSDAVVADIAARLAALEADVAYASDAVVLDRLAKIDSDAARFGLEAIVARVATLRDEVKLNAKNDVKGAFRIKRLDIQKPTPDNGQHWVAVVTFQVTRNVTAPFRINFYTVLPNGDLYGSCVNCGNVVWESAGQEFSHALALDVADVGTKPLKWRVEIGWEGVCCAQSETAGSAGKAWWLAPPGHSHLSFTQRRRDAPGAFRVLSWGRVSEAGVRDRLRPAAAASK